MTRQKKELIKKIDKMDTELEMEISVEKDLSFGIGPLAGAFADREDKLGRLISWCCDGLGLSASPLLF